MAGMRSLCKLLLLFLLCVSCVSGDNSSPNYADALSKSILFFEAQRSGKLPANQRVTWRRDSALSDGSSQHVGEPNMDHNCWERPEDMDTPRTVYKIDAQNPGSDVAAETAAALAAASMVFQVSDASYSHRLLQTAMRVFDFADKHRGAYSDSLKSAVCPFYCSYSGYRDELLWGAAWLHTASQNASYLSYIRTNGQALGADDSDNSFSWDNKHVGTRVLLSKKFLVQKVQLLESYKAHADIFICSLLPETSTYQAEYTPGGLLYKHSDSNMQYVTATSFILLTYAKYLSSSSQVVRCGSSTATPERLRSIAKRQVDYILGDNPLKMSYMVGYGPKFPQHVHHRGSSIPSVVQHPQVIGCGNGFSYFSSNDPNPNILVGAVVGGPDNKDQFADDRSAYAQSEPATYMNAPLGCPTEERQALLKLRTSIDDSNAHLKPWEGVECCRWRGVKCSYGEAMHVATLDLHGFHLSTLIHAQMDSSFFQL
eukprot:Gb_40488 [translate_table: standard]